MKLNSNFKYLYLHRFYLFTCKNRKLIIKYRKLSHEVLLTCLFFLSFYPYFLSGVSGKNENK
ncbi:MAG: hypothetical protein A2000_14580 [Ignavibacteria bacterium GWB2_36_8]|nr:MAG: hypothetical protein A2000_14580 [Ignavibacteria bacterium GWB2_36_8]OGU52113.1 MAG: hypothetical protein A2080_03655 [Ignavibacteria bacterium GWC2_36_12]